ncbi:Tol-Pal system beta propeller repeat protein TolB [Chromatiales bacterium (ex Bugula neritina AB1)]|nr:Tol-Pal system beta propeller repeat protein TolB [Chromatiales bacterium (ex Bugula neritina AB1)]
MFETDKGIIATRLHRAVAIFLLCLLPGQSQAVLRIDITDTAGLQDAIPIAVVPFATGAQGLDVDISEVLANDLKRSGRFKVLPGSSLRAFPQSTSQVRYADWNDTDIEYLVVGRVAESGNGNLQIQFELVDMVKQIRMLAYAPNDQGVVEYCCRYQVGRDQVRQTGHTIANLVYEQIIGVPGVFDTKFAYITAVGEKDNKRYALELADIDGNNITRVLEISRPILSPSWSPDGEQLAYVSFEFPGRTAIILHHLAKAERRKLISIEGINGAPAWSPDGRRLALSLSHRGSPDIYMVNVASGQLSQLTNEPSIETEAAWLDDDTIVFTSNRSGTPQIYRKNLSDGTPAQRLTFEGKYNAGATVSPGGSKIAFIHSEDGNFRIATLDLNSRVLEVLTDGRLDESPSFAPNGEMVLYATEENGRGVLGLVSVDGLVTQRVSLANENVRDPAWGPKR